MADAAKIMGIVERINTNNALIARLAKQSRKSVEAFKDYMESGKVRGSRAELMVGEYKRWKDEEAAINKAMGKAEEIKQEDLIPMVVSTVLSAEDLPMNVIQIEEALRGDEGGGLLADGRRLTRAEMIAAIREKRDQMVKKYSGFNRMSSAQLRKLLEE